MMRRRTRMHSVLLAALVPISFQAVNRSSTAQPPDAAPRFELVGRYSTGGGAGTGEIVAISGNTMYVTDGQGVDVVNIANPADPRARGRLEVPATVGEPTSVAASGAIVAIAAPALVRTDPGFVFIFENGRLISTITVGALPDSLAIRNDWIVVANEGEPKSYGQADSVDPEGSISVINIPLAKSRNGRAHRLIPFTPFNVGGPRAAEADGLRFNGPGATRAQDIEPEYVSFEGNRAYVTLQENNAIAVVDFRTATIVDLLPLGVKNHEIAGAGIDPSDRDNAVNIQTVPVSGMYMPDGIAAFAGPNGVLLATANEGDGRDYTGFGDEARVSTLSLDPTAYPNAAELKANARLGRLNASRTDGDIDGDTDIDRIHSYGARSMSLWTASGDLVWDSGDLFERITADAAPGYFNTDSGSAFDTRSDNKGPEPEAVVTGVVRGKQLAFVGLERMDGVVVLDITDPTAPSFNQYLTDRTQFSSPDIAPEGLVFVGENRAPGRRALLAVAHELTGTVTIYQEVPRAISETADGAGRLTLLHNNDGESSLLALTNPGNLPVGGISGFASVVERETADGRNRNNAVLNVYAGDAFLASSTLACSLPPNPANNPVFDAKAQALIGYDVQAIGNHEFDFGPDFLAKFIEEHAVGGVLSTPFLGANLDFSGEPAFDNLIDADGLVLQDASGRVVGRSAIVVDGPTKQRFGVVSAITPALPTISSPRNVVVTTRDLVETAATLQVEIDRLTARGVRKIILVSHLQNLANDRELVRLLRRVDVAVAGGGDEQLQNPSIPDAKELLPGDPAAIDTYPVWENDAQGRQVPIVTTSGNYKYVGRIDLTFDSQGNLASVDERRTYPRRVVPVSTVSATLGVFDSVVPDQTLIDQIETPVKACLAAYDQPIASTDVSLNVSRAGNASLGFTTGVRSGETNGGNLVADGFLHAYDTYGPGFGLPARGAGNPVIAVQNGGGIRQNAGDVLPVGGVAPGTISRRNTLDVMAFLTNTITVVNELTPTELKSVLERSVSSPGGGQFLQIAGMTITYDRTRQAQVVANPAPGQTAGTITTQGDRIRTVTLSDGTPIVVDGAVVPTAPNVRMVTNSFTADGGDNYPDLAAETDTVNLPLTYESALTEYLLTFPAGTSGLPTIPATDVRYANPAGEGRIQVVVPVP